MLRVGSAAAVAEEDDLSAGLDPLRCLPRQCRHRAGKGLLGCEGDRYVVVELRVERVLVEELCCHSFILSCNGRTCRTPPEDVGIAPSQERQQRKDRG